MRTFRGGLDGYKHFAWGVGIASLVLTATACGSPDVEVPIVLNDFGYEPKQITIERGKRAVLVLQNKGAVEHNLAVQRQPVTSQTLQPGQTVKMELQLPAGNYPIVCTIPGHEEAGMTGQITSARGR